MFTGIIESTGIIQSIISSGSNLSFWIESPISKELKPDQSVAHNGVCLTVEEVLNGQHRVTAIEETLTKTTLGKWETGSLVNLERCLPMNGRLDGHLVQGHVDTVAVCENIFEKSGSYEFRFNFPKSFASLMIEKGSITINGISLTSFNLTENSFDVAIIPYTFEHSNMNSLRIGDPVNIEFDMVGKYVNRFMQLR